MPRKLLSYLTFLVVGDSQVPVLVLGFQCEFELTNLLLMQILWQKEQNMTASMQYHANFYFPWHSQARNKEAKVTSRTLTEVGNRVGVEEEDVEEEEEVGKTRRAKEGIEEATNIQTVEKITIVPVGMIAQSEETHRVLTVGKMKSMDEKVQRWIKKKAIPRRKDGEDGAVAEVEVEVAQGMIVAKRVELLRVTLGGGNEILL